MKPFGFFFSGIHKRTQANQSMHRGYSKQGLVTGKACKPYALRGGDGELSQSSDTNEKPSDTQYSNPGVSLRKRKAQSLSSETNPKIPLNSFRKAQDYAGYLKYNAKQYPAMSQMVFRIVESLMEPAAHQTLQANKRRVRSKSVNANALQKAVYEAELKPMRKRANPSKLLPLKKHDALLGKSSTLRITNKVQENDRTRSTAPLVSQSTEILGDDKEGSSVTANLNTTSEVAQVTPVSGMDGDGLTVRHRGEPIYPTVLENDRTLSPAPFVPQSTEIIVGDKERSPVITNLNTTPDVSKVTSESSDSDNESTHSDPDIDVVTINNDPDSDEENN